MPHNHHLAALKCLLFKTEAEVNLKKKRATMQVSHDEQQDTGKRKMVNGGWLIWMKTISHRVL